MEVEHITRQIFGPGILAEKEKPDRSGSGFYDRPRLYSCTGIIPEMLAKPEVGASLNVFLVHRVSWETENVY